jgi:alpha-1,6-mannosyltransferase
MCGSDVALYDLDRPSSPTSRTVLPSTCPPTSGPYGRKRSHDSLLSDLDACRPGRRNNERIPATTTITRGGSDGQASVDAARADIATRAPSGALRALGALGLGGVLVSVFLLSAGAAGSPSIYVPGRSGGWPGWLAGPLRGLGLGLSSSGFQTLTLIMCASYVAVLLTTRALSLRAIAATILAANLILLLGPPLISQDVFGYLAFARMGVLHGLDPYTHVAFEAPTDPVYPFIGWPHLHSPYGPLFTLVSYATAPLGLAGGLWALKAAAVVGSLAAVALTARAAAALGRSPRFAAALLGLNPVMLELAVGGAHNDTLVLAFLAGTLLLTAGTTVVTGASAPAGALAAPSSAVGTTDTRSQSQSSTAPRAAAPGRYRAGALTLAAGVGIKVTAGVALPFLVLSRPSWRERARVALAAAAGLALVAIAGLIGFGSHALGFLDAVGEQQQLVAVHSVPAETARLFGLHGTPGWWRRCFVIGLGLVLCYALWRTARGADWRVAAGWTTLALLLATAWLLPWYAIWALPLAAVSGNRRLCAATLLVCAYAILIHLPLADPLLSAPTLHTAPRHGHVGALGR